MTVSIKTMTGDIDEALGVAVYAFSAVHDLEAIRLQVDDCEAFARSKFSGRPAVFFDTGISGPAAGRKGLNELMTEIEAGTVVAVVTRDVADFEVVVGNPARVVHSLRVEPPEEDRCPHC